LKGKLLFTLVALVYSSVLFAADASSGFKGAVNAAAKEFMDAINAKDSARVGMLYAKDAIAFPPNAEMANGREAIQALWKGFIDGGMKAQIETVEMEMEGKLGSEVGKYTITDATGKTVDQGKYVVVWKKGSEGWKLYRDIWNSNMPAATP